jgi:hypothetical protein
MLPLVLPHVPPTGVADSVIEEVTHTGALPVMVPGKALTVSTDVRKQPLARV